MEHESSGSSAKSGKSSGGGGDGWAGTAKSGKSGGSDLWGSSGSKSSKLALIHGVPQARRPSPARSRAETRGLDQMMVLPGVTHGVVTNK